MAHIVLKTTTSELMRPAEGYSDIDLIKEE